MTARASAGGRGKPGESAKKETVSGTPPEHKKSGWTAEHSARQSQAIHTWKPWLKTRGPVTEAGKARVALNLTPADRRNRDRGRASIKKLRQARRAYLFLHFSAPTNFDDFDRWPRDVTQFLAKASAAWGTLKAARDVYLAKMQHLGLPVDDRLAEMPEHPRAEHERLCRELKQALEDIGALPPRS